MQDLIILVDEYDNTIGAMGKLETHQKGLLHRAFSVFVFNDANELLLQRRAMGKYHSEGLWTNTCCSHPWKDEEVVPAAHRRLMEEMGFDCPLEKVYAFVYQTSFENGLIEHEFDHVLVGEWDGTPVPNPEEVMEWRSVGIPELRKECAEYPERFTYWLKFALEEVLKNAKRA